MPLLPLLLRVFARRQRQEPRRPFVFEVMLSFEGPWPRLHSFRLRGERFSRCWYLMNPWLGHLQGGARTYIGARLSVGLYRDLCTPWQWISVAKKHSAYLSAR